MPPYIALLDKEGSELAAAGGYHRLDVGSKTFKMGPPMPGEEGAQFTALNMEPFSWTATKDWKAVAHFVAVYDDVDSSEALLMSPLSNMMVMKAKDSLVIPPGSLCFNWFKRAVVPEGKNTPDMERLVSRVDILTDLLREAHDMLDPATDLSKRIKQALMS